ncbi:Delta-type opioid receptor [Mactra antiquata]
MESFHSSIDQRNDNEINYDVNIRALEHRRNMDDLLLVPTTVNSTLADPCIGMDFNESHCQSIVHEFTSSDHWFESSTETLLVILYCVAIVLGILGNAIVCYVVMKFSHLHKPRNFLILNLSVCGIIMCVFCMPFSLIRILLKNWHLGEILCRLSPTLQTLDVFVSTFTIVAIAVDRYSAIVRARREESNKIFVCYTITTIWIVSILLCVPMMIFHEVQDVYPEDMNVRLYKICMEVWPENEIWKKMYTTFVLMIQYVVPLAIISTLHGRICQFLRVRISRNPRTEREAERILRDIKRQQKNMLLLTAIAVTFAISWLPLTILNTLADYDYALFLNKNFNHAYSYCLLAAMCSAFLNPIVYGWFNSNFRKAFLQVLCSIRHSVTDFTEMATIKNDSRGNSHQPYRFYSSLQLECASPVEPLKSVSNKSSISSRKSFQRSKSGSGRSINSMNSVRILDTIHSDS